MVENDKQMVLGSNLAQTLIRMKKNECAKYLRNQIIDGEIDELAAVMLLKKFADIYKSVWDDESIKSKFISEAAKYKVNGGTLEYMGHEIQIQNQTRYSYEECGDPIMDDLLAVQAETKAKIEARQIVLKAHKTEWADLELEGVVINPPCTIYTTVVKIMEI